MVQRLRRMDITWSLLLCVASVFQATMAQTVANFHTTSVTVVGQVSGGMEFGIDVVGSNFDTQNDKIMLIQKDLVCGVGRPPVGDPNSTAGWDALSCAGGGSAATKLVCNGVRVYQSGTYKVCLCDADGNVTTALPQIVNPATSGCASLERFYLSSSVAGLNPTGQIIQIYGPNPTATLRWRTGASTQLMIYGQRLNDGDRVRIISNALSCWNISQPKTMHMAVNKQFLGQRSLGLSNKNSEVWENVMIHQTGRYNVCWCGPNSNGCDTDDDFVVHAATILVDGPAGNLQRMLCVTGVPCGIAVHGQGLSDLDRIIIIEGHGTCGSMAGTSARISGAVGQRNYGTATMSRWDGLLTSRGGTFKICWCGALNGVGTCVSPPEFNMWAGNITVGGPTQGVTKRPPLGKPYTYVITGWGLSTNDRISIVDSSQKCNSPGAERWSDGIYRVVDQVGQPPKANVGTDPNLTAAGWTDIVFISMRDYKVCWCARNVNFCQSGINFALEIGQIRPTGPKNTTGNPRLVVPHKPFPLTIEGSPGTKLSIHDRVRIVSSNVVQGRCGNSGSRKQAVEVATTACFPQCNPTKTSGAPLLQHSNTTAVWDPTMLTGSGTFLMCWCPDGYQFCDSDEDFKIEAGVIISSGVSTSNSWKCASFLDCTLELPAAAAHLTAGDSLQLIDGASSSACGHSAQADSSKFTLGTRVLGSSGTSQSGDPILTFPLGKPQSPSVYKVCYCQKPSPCATDLDFYQQTGILSVTGLTSSSSVFVCYKQNTCVLQVSGIDLTNSDSIVLNAPTTSCGMRGAETSVFNALFISGQDGSRLYSGTYVGLLTTNAQLWDFNMGYPSATSSYRICYCVHGLSGSAGCGRRDLHTQQAGEVHVRGITWKVDQLCDQGEPCAIVLRSLQFDQADRIVLANENATCGNALASVPAWSKAITPVSITPDMANPTLKAAFYRVSAATPGKFKICYCAHVNGASSCVKTGTPDDPNRIRFGLDAGKLVVSGGIKQVIPTPNLPTTAEFASVMVEALRPGMYIHCAATATQAPHGFVPRKSDIENCTLGANSVFGRQRLFPRCVGTGRMQTLTTMGWNHVHVNIPPLNSALPALTKVYVWCYTDIMCSSDHCVVPPNNVGLELPVTSGLQSTSNRWQATIATSFDLRVQAASDYNVGTDWARIKLVREGNLCHYTQMYAGITGLQCLAVPNGKCTTVPRSLITSDSSGVKRELIWDGVTIPRGGKFTACYCDRHYGQSCHLWYGIGTVNVAGPRFVGLAKYSSNPNQFFKLAINGQDLSLNDRIRILPQYTSCDFPPNATFDYRSGAPSKYNSTYSDWDVKIINIGHYEVCWCGGLSRTCTSHNDFTVRLGSLHVTPKADCVMGLWFIVPPGCDKSCGGGNATYRRGIVEHPKGGGAPCPTSFYKSEACNTHACPLARVDDTWTVPSVVHEMEVFRLHISGYDFTPAEDKVLLVSESVQCGDVQSRSQHAGGAACGYTGSTDQQLICGDGVGSFRVGQHGNFRICVCDASAALVSTFQGTSQIATGSNAAIGLTAAGCNEPRNFQLAPQLRKIVTILPAVQSKRKEKKSSTPLIIALIGAAVAICLAGCVGFAIYQRLGKQKEEVLHGPIEAKVVDEETGKEGLFDNNMLALQDNNMQALQYYEQLWQQAGYAPGAAMQALGDMAPQPQQQMFALTNGDSSALLQYQGMTFEPPPPSPWGPLALAPPPPMAPPKLSMPPGVSPRGGRSPRDGSRSPRTSLVKRQKTFGDLVKEAEKRPVSPVRSFSEMRLTPLPTPTGTPRAGTPPDHNGSGTPRGGTPRGHTPRGRDDRPGTADSSMLALEDSRPCTAETEISGGSAFNTGSSWRPSTGGTDARPQSALSNLSALSSVSTSQAPADTSASHSGSIPTLGLPLAPASFGATIERLPGIEERPNSASSGTSKESLALSESTAAGGALDKSPKHTGKSRRASKGPQTSLTQSALKAHNSALGEADPDSDARTPRTPASNTTPRGLASLFGGASKVFGLGSASKENKAAEPSPSPPAFGGITEVDDDADDAAAAPPARFLKALNLTPSETPHPPEKIESPRLPPEPPSEANVAAPVPPEPPAPEVQETFFYSVPPPEPPAPEASEVVQSTPVPPEPPSEVIDAATASVPPEPPAPEVLEEPQSPPSPPKIPDSVPVPPEPVPVPPEPEVHEQPPPPPKNISEPQSISEKLEKTRDGLAAPPSASLARLKNRFLPGVPGSPNHQSDSDVETSRPPPPPKSQKPLDRSPAATPSTSPRAPGPALDGDGGANKRVHSLRGLAHSHERERSHEADSEASQPMTSPGSPSRKMKGAPPPPPGKPPKGTPGPVLGPGPKLAGLMVDTDNLEDTMNSTGSGHSSRGSPGGKKAFSLGGMAVSTGNVVRALPKAARESPKAQPKSRPSTATVRSAGPGPAFGKTDSNGMPPPPPLPPNVKAGVSSAGPPNSSMNAWG